MMSCQNVDFLIINAARFSEVFTLSAIFILELTTTYTHVWATFWTNKPLWRVKPAYKMH